MKKFYLAGFALLAMLLTSPVAAQSYSPTATDEIYDFSGFDTKKMLDLFYQASVAGRNYPTMEEFEAAGIQASDIAFVRSHVRRANIMSRADRLVPTTYETRNLFVNMPMDVGSDGLGGYPNDKFTADVFSMWQYTNLFGSWNHSFFQAPGAWVDAAHRNGTDIMSGIAFFESWTGDGDKTYSAMIVEKDGNGDFKYVKPVINILMFFGSDGINYNWEDDSYKNADIVAFHKALWAYAKEVGFDNYHSAIYTSASTMTAGNVNALFGNSTGKTHDTMLNYSNGDFSYGIATSVTSAENAMGTADGLYAGVWTVGMDRDWECLDADAQSHKCGICIWGEHGQSRFMSYNTGDGAFDTQGNYQRLLERAFSGGNRNPVIRPTVTSTNSGKINWETTTVDGETRLPLQLFAGLAHWIPERSVLERDLPFGTHFTLGNGDRYYYKGKKSFAGSWYNMGAQDVVPTYRWLIYAANSTTVSNDVEVNYTHLDAYTGGSCIELTGKATATGTDIVLYKTALKVAGSNPYAKVAVKTLKDDAKATNLYLIVRKQGENTWQEYAVADVAGNTWEEKKFDLSNLSTGDVIDRIGLRVKGSDENYQMYVGKLEINDNKTVTPSNVKDLVVEVKEETQSSMTMKMHWDVEAAAGTRANWGLVYNDEANIDHFEILYKVGEDGKISKVGTTSQWATLIPNIEFESVNDKPFIGVRSVSVDLKTYSPVVWVEVPRAAQSALPQKEEVDTYGVSAMDPACEGADIARAQRYLEWVKTTGATQNLDYTADGPVADGSQYANAKNHVLKVEQGQTITMTFKAADQSDGLKYCFAGGWMDLNASGDFDHPLPIQRTDAEIAAGKTDVDPEGERLFFAGTIRAATEAFQYGVGYSFNFTVPEDATPGKSRLRMVFSDAWFAGMFNPTGLHAKGFTIDFGVEIIGSNPGRVAADTRDAGEAEEPEGLGDIDTAINDVNAGEVSNAVLDGDVINFNNVEKAWIYSVDGRLVEFVNGNPTHVNAAQYPAGVYLVKMQYKNVIRSAKVVIE